MTVQLQRDNAPDEKTRMRRSLGLGDGIAMIIGVIVGSGIFISPKGVLLHTGSVGAALVVWCLSGLLALLGALCFAELGTSISTSGGEFTYINLAYGPLASYIYIWVLVLIIMPCSNAISALTFANYCLQPLFEAGTEPPEEAVRLLALAVLMLIIYLNCSNLDGSIVLQNTFTCAKVLALGSIILYGVYFTAAGNEFRSLKGNPKPVQPKASDHDAELGAGWWSGTLTSVPQLALAFYSGFFTYSGWNSLNAVTEEIKTPHKNMPRAIIISICSVTFIYILANAAYFAVLTKEEILESDAIAVQFGNKTFGPIRWIMPLVVAMSTVGGLNALIFAASRIYFAAAREGQLFNALAMISPSKLTPIPSLMFLGITSTVYLVTTKITSLIEYMTFIEASFAALGVSTMLVLRYQKPDLERPLKIPIVIPIIYLAFTATFLVLPLFDSPLKASIGICIATTGWPAYYLTAKWEKKPRWYQRSIDKFNMVVQKLTCCVLTDKELS